MNRQSTAGAAELPTTSFCWATELAMTREPVTLSVKDAWEVSAEMQRQHAELETLRNRAQDSGRPLSCLGSDAIRADYDAARLEIESLRSQVEALSAAQAVVPAGHVLVPRETLVAWRQWCAQSMSHAIEHEVSDYLAAVPPQPSPSPAPAQPGQNECNYPPLPDAAGWLKRKDGIQVLGFTPSQMFGFVDADRAARAAPQPAMAAPVPGDDELTACYRDANGELLGKAQPLTTQRIFRAMRAAIVKWSAPQPAAPAQQAAPAAVAGPSGYGPKVAVRRSCSDCKACNSESYAVQGDSGHYVYCEHPSLPESKYIGDTNWNTPHWCPVSAPTTQPEPQPSPAAQGDALDAVRYRWLRNPTTDVALVLDKRTGYVPGDELVPGVGGYHTYEYRAGDELDAAIDAALTAQREVKP